MFPPEFLCLLRDSVGDMVSHRYVRRHIHGNAGYDVMATPPKSGAPVLERSSRFMGLPVIPTTSPLPWTRLCVTRRLVDAIGKSADASPTMRSCRSARDPSEGPLSATRGEEYTSENLLAPNAALFEQFWQAARVAFA